MKAKVLKDFNDKYTGRRYKAGEIISISEERFEEILTVDKLVEEVIEVAEEVTEEPKKTTRKATKKSAK